jgi:hypothetical protein
VIERIVDVAFERLWKRLVEPNHVEAEIRVEPHTVYDVGNLIRVLVLKKQMPRPMNFAVDC